MQRNRILTAILLLAASPTLGSPARAEEAPERDVIGIGTFSEAPEDADLPEGWEPLDFAKIERKTSYRLVEDEGGRVIRARSNASASGLIYPIDVDLGAYPILEWRWKIEHILEQSDVRDKRGDDYPARVYVAFVYEPERVGFWEKAKYAAARFVRGEFPPTSAINYIWSTNAPVGEIHPNAFSDRVRMIVVESGSAQAGHWQREERNVYQDYLRAYGEPPPKVSGIAIMTDTDNTGDSVVAWYGDLRFRKAARPPH